MTNQPDFRKLLEASTPGPWKIERGKRCIQGPDTREGDPLVLTSMMGGATKWSHSPYSEYCVPGMHEGDANAALIVAAVNALPEHLARIAELEAENAILKRLAPEYFRWTGGPDQTEDPEWACDKLKYGGAHFENIGTPQVRLVVYDDQDRRWVAERGDYIVKDHNGLWVLPALSGGKP
jgi:hypothetical protein